MHAKYEVSISYGLKVIAKVKVDNRQIDRRTGQKQYAPDHSIRGHKNGWEWWMMNELQLVKLLSSDQIGKFVFFMFLLSIYYQYYSVSGVAPRRKVCVCVGGRGGGPNITVSPTFQSGDEARVRYSPIILSTELLLTFYTLSIIAEVTRLNLTKKKRRGFLR